MENPLQCPCCDYFTLPTRHDYEICPICFWEDEGVDVDEPDEESAANHGLNLRQARANFQAIGACEPSMLEHVLPPERRVGYRYVPRAI